jgi:hypothetical protein
MPGDAPLDALTSSITRDFWLNGGRPQLADEAFTGYVGQMVELPAARKHTVAVELLAIVRKLWNDNNEAWDDAIVQLSILIQTAIGEGQLKEALHRELGSQAEHVIGTAKAAVRPVGADRRPAGSTSPLQARLLRGSAGAKTPTKNGQDEP